jgi:acylphosphatase
MDQIAKHIIFKGQVQSVGFRYTTHRVATRYNVTGFVRNLPDGTVEMLVQGTEQNVDACLADLEDTMAGYIRDMKIKKISPAPHHTDFKITF